MRSRKRLLNNSRLYLILDTGVCDYPKLFEIARQAIEAKIDIIQLRDKKGLAKDIFITSEFQKAKFRFRLWRDQIGKFRCDPAKGGPKEDSVRANASAYLDFSKQLIQWTRGTKTLFILNDRVDLALAVGADGVHLGQEDLPLKEARKILGSKVLIGVSCQALGHALQAEREGADYIGFGSVFKTLTKPDREPVNLKWFQEVVKKLKIPVFAIGGITLDNTSKLTEIGIKRVAVCRGILEAENVAGSIREFQQRLK